MSAECETTPAAIARLDTKLAALEARMDRDDEVMMDRIRVAKGHLDHRLDVLNHAHEQAIQDRSQFVTRIEARWLIGTMTVVLLAILGYVVALK